MTAFREPYEDADDHYDHAFRISQNIDFVKNEMHTLKQEAFDRLSLMVHPNYVEDFAKILSYARDNISEGEKIIDLCNLSNLHFLAIEDAFDEFDKEMRDTYDF
jgi:hypothetical protein